MVVGGARPAGPHVAQRAVQHAEHEIAHRPCVSEANFGLARVNVDVDLPRIQFEIEHENRMASVEQHVAVGLPDRVCDQVVLHRTAVDEEELMV